MNKKHLLFVCTANQERSPTAERLFLHSDKYEAKSAGIAEYAETRISRQAIEWADQVFVMEDVHKRYIEENFPGYDCNKIKVLDILDDYYENEPELIEILKLRLKSYLNNTDI
jgi:predicted protein tyrosine phosphatase